MTDYSHTTASRIEARRTGEWTEDEEQTSDSTVPIAVPFASLDPSSSGQLSAESVPPSEGTDAAQPRSTPARRGRRRVDIEQLRDQLGAAGWRTLELIEQHRFLTTLQLTGLYFTDRHTLDSAPVAARRVTRWLRYHHLVGTLDRRIGGVRAGSTGLVWFLTERGHRLLHPDHSGRHRPSEPSTTFLKHTLAITDTRLALVAAERADVLELVDCQIEPAAWRRFLTPAGTVQPLRADLYVELAIPPQSDELLTTFIEVDRGTEHLPTLLRKCRAYAAYARSGQADRDGGMPLVIWQLTARTPELAARRREQLTEGITKDPRLDARMFRVTSPDQLVTTLLHDAGQKGDIE